MLMAMAERAFWFSSIDTMVNFHKRYRNRIFFKKTKKKVGNVDIEKDKSEYKR